MTTISSAMSFMTALHRNAVLEHQDHVLAVRHKGQFVAVEAVRQRNEVGPK